VAVPPQERVGLYDDQGLPPRPHAAGQQDQERPVHRGAARALDAAPQDGELVAQQGVLGDQGGLAAREVRQGTDDERHGVGLGGDHEAMG